MTATQTPGTVPSAPDFACRGSRMCRRPVTPALSVRVRDGQRGVVQDDDVGGGRAERHAPPGAIVRTSDGQHAARAAVQKRRPHAGVAEDHGGAVERVALGDATEVDRRRAARDSNRARGLVELDSTRSGATAGRYRGFSGAATDEERCDRDVEGAPGRTADLERVGEEVERLPVEPDRLAGAPVEVRHEAVGREPVEAPMPVVDFVDRGLAGRTKRRSFRAAGGGRQKELEPRAHGRGRQAQRGSRQTFLTFCRDGSYENAPPSQSERVARSTITMIFVPSSTVLRGCCRVRMQSSQ